VERMTTHGYRRGPRRGPRQESPVYQAWCAMWFRCTNENSTAWEYYGGRGIKVCDEWRTFGQFLEDVGERPSPRHRLERVDKAGDWEPSNVQWLERRPKRKARRRLRRPRLPRSWRRTGASVDDRHP
jgi:hypothetical protein